MIEFYLTKEELEKALVCLQQLEDRGFPASQAVFGLCKVGKDVLSEEYEFKDQIILRAVPNDDSKNWGRITKEMISWGRYENGVMINTYKEKEHETEK